MQQSDIHGPAAALTPRELRDVFGCFVTGVTVVTVVDTQSRPHGITANSFSSVSLDPPLVLWSQALAAPSHPLFRDAEHLAINILAEDQVDVSARFSRPHPDRFAGLDTVPGLGGVPLIRGCVAHIECTRHALYPGGDHAVFLCAVQRIARREGRSLAFAGGRYVCTQPHDALPTPPPRREAHALEKTT